MARAIRSRAPWVVAAAVGLCLAARPARATDPEIGEKVYKRTLASTVWVWVPQEREGTRVRLATGTGSVLDVPRKLILTNYHVVGDKEEAYVFFPLMDKGEVVADKEVYRRGKTRIRGKVIARDAKRDLALIQVEAIPTGAKALHLAAHSASPGQNLHSVGNPGASDALWVYTPGTVRQVYHKRFVTGAKGEGGFEVDARIVETQSPVNAGDSGGPVVNDRGELVAVVQGHLSDAQARLVSIFIDVSEVRALLKAKRLGSIAAMTPEPVVATAPRPAAVQPTSDNATAKEKPSAEDAEHEAARKFKFAKMLAEGGVTDKAKARCQEIVKSYPKTKAADEARRLLDQLEKLEK